MEATFVYLTPGKPDLLVLKAINAIRQADILVGKPELLLELSEFTAKNCKRVSNLAELSNVLPRTRKNGFARLVRVLPAEHIGTDRLLGELRFFSDAGYETAIIPGVSPIQTEAADKHIPLTLRGGSQGFFVIDCRNIAAGHLFGQVRIAAAASATLVLCHAGAHEETLLRLIVRERGGELLLHRGRIIIAARRPQAFPRCNKSSLVQRV